PGVGGALTDPAVGDDVAVRSQTQVVQVELLQFSGGAEGAVIVRGFRPRNGLGGGDVAAAQCALLRVGGHVGALARVLLAAAHVDQRDVADRVADLRQEGADAGVVALDDRVFGGGGLGLLPRVLAALRLPLLAATV